MRGGPVTTRDVEGIGGRGLTLDAAERRIVPAIEWVPEPRRPANYSARPVAERLLERIAHEGDACTVWTGNRGSSGYGQIRVDGVMWSVHRLVWTLHFGRIPDGLVVMHLCDTPACVEIHHLALGTPEANIYDREQKGRGVTPARDAR